MIEEIIYAKRGRWLVMLAQGWRLNLGWHGLVAEPMAGNHGQYAVMLWRR